MLKKWKTIHSKLALDNKWFKVQQDIVELPNGKVLDDYLFWKEPNVSQIVAITKENKIILVRQYKHAIGDFIVECPAGFVDDGETFEDAARRELLEETGYNSKKMVCLGQVTHNPTKSCGIVKIFLTKNIEKTSSQKLDKNEDIEILELSIEEVLNMIYIGEIWTTGTITAMFLALKKIGYKL